MATKRALWKEFLRVEQDMIDYANRKQPRKPATAHPNSTVGRNSRERNSVVESPIATLAALVAIVVIPIWATSQISALPNSVIQGLWVVPVWFGFLVACVAAIVGLMVAAFKYGNSEGHMEYLLRASGWQEYYEAADTFHKEAKRRFGDENWNQFCQVYGMYDPTLFYRNR